MNTDELKFLPKRYRKRVAGLLLQRDTLAFMRGVDQGRKTQLADSAKTAQVMRPDMMISVQRLAESNAQLGTVLGRILERI